MNETDREFVFSEAVKAGKRIYYFDVRQSKGGDLYLSITESKKKVEGTPEDPHITFEKHKLFLYKEDFEKFMNALNHTFDIVKTGIVPKANEPKTNEPKAESAAKTESKLNAKPVAKAEPIATEHNASEHKDESDCYKIDLDF